MKVIRSLPPLPSTERGTTTRIAFDPAAEKVLYCNENNIICRPVAPLLDGKGGGNPEDMFTFQNHARKVTCCAVSPNNNWVATGDSVGNLKVWGTRGEHVLKGEYQLWAGAVKDVGWSGDSTRIVAAGDGSQTKAVALIWDTGSKTGEVAGHSKAVNSISFRSQRPFRIITGSEDMSVNIHQGPPFKILQTQQDTHSNFVNWVGYSPDGEWAASAGSDSKIALYSGKEGEKAKEFQKPADMTGSIWDGAWSPDSARLVTAGGDKKIRVWDRETGTQVCEALVGTGALPDMQVGVCWNSPSQIASVCLDGRILFWDLTVEGALALTTTVDGTQGHLVALARDAKSGILVAGSSDGTVAIIPPEQPAKKAVVGKTIQHVVCHQIEGATDEAWVTSLDNCVRRLSLETCAFVGDPIDVKECICGAAWLDAGETKLLVATSKNNFKCVSDKAVEWTKESVVSRRPTALTTLPGSKVAVAIEKGTGGSFGATAPPAAIHLLTIADASNVDGVVEEAVLEAHVEDIQCLSFSPTGDFLASCDSAKVLNVFCLKDGNARMIFESVPHTARISALAWLPNGQLVSGGLDQNIALWDIDAATKKCKYIKDKFTKGAHRGGVSALVTCGESEFASVGLDGFVTIRSAA